MRLLAVGVALWCAWASAAQAHRGWLSGAGLMLAGVGVVAVSVGAYNAAQGDSAAHAVGAYYVNGAAPTGAEASTLRWLEERAETLSSLGLGLMVGGGVAIALGVSMILLDGWLGDTKVSLAIAPGRASVLVSGTF